jgi:hypothetical protein
LTDHGLSKRVAARVRPEAIRTIFAQPDAAHVRKQLDTIAGMLDRQLFKVETMLRDAGPDITAFADFPVPHWKNYGRFDPRGLLQQRSAALTAVTSASRQLGEFMLFGRHKSNDDKPGAAGIMPLPARSVE